MLTPANSTVALVRTTAAVALGFAVGIAAAIIGVSTAAMPAAPQATITLATPSAGQPAPAPRASRIVDVSSASMSAAGALDTLVALLQLSPDERVVAIDGAPASDGLGRLATAWTAVAPGDFIDLEIRNDDGDERRIVLLVHP